MVAVDTGREEENQCTIRLWQQLTQEREEENKSTIRLWQQLTQEEKKKIKVLLGYGSS